MKTQSYYLITDFDENFPLFITDTLENVKKLLDEYMGLGKDERVKYLEFIEFDNCGYPNMFEGIYKYTDDEDIQKFNRYYLTLNVLR